MSQVEASQVWYRFSEREGKQALQHFPASLGKVKENLIQPEVV